MKILFITHTPSLLGANRSLLDLMEELQQMGYQSMVISPVEGELSIELNRLGIPNKVMPFLNWTYTKVTKEYWLFNRMIQQNDAFMEAILTSVKTEEIDIVHSNTSLFMVGAYLADKLKVPHVWHIREMMRLHFETDYLLGEELFKYWMNKAGCVISISQVVENEVLKHISAPKKVIFDAVFSKKQLNAIAQKRLEKSTKSSYQFLSVGLLHPQKAQMEALKAFHQLSKKYEHIRFVIVGKGRRLYTLRMKSYVAFYGLKDKVEFTGYQANPEPYYLASDAFLMCSRHEAMGRVTVEALAYGLTVIAKKSGGTPEIIQHEKNGLLYENGVEDLVARMEWGLQNESLTKKMQEKGFDTVKNKFMAKDYVGKMMTIYNKLLGNEE